MCCGNQWGGSVGHESGSHGAITNFQRLSSAEWHPAFVSKLTSKSVCGRRKGTKGRIAFCRVLCNFSVDLQMSVNLRYRTVRIWYTGVKPGMMQEGAVFPGAFQGLLPACCIILCSASAAQLALPQESLMSHFGNPLYFPTVAGVLDTLEFFCWFYNC